ncbi:MAG: potassium-transporting ATPase subunit KdpC [Candidatus Schekmanbacteria bacterium]|nr:potassium-transporting ATPase subunit KdpC [Candidatus Schekmanbacteria bacterium]
MRMIRPVIVSLIVFTVITGIIYPLIVTGIAQLIFPVQANGSIIIKNGKPAGSALIGQSFDSPGYFWGRLSATQPFPYNSASSSGSNLAQSNPALVKQAKERISTLRDADPQAPAMVPVDLATASASGIDPDITPAAAEYQVKRVAKARRLSEARVSALVTQFTEDRQFGILGEPAVNVLKLNLALDDIQKNETNERIKHE